MYKVWLLCLWVVSFSSACEVKPWWWETPWENPPNNNQGGGCSESQRGGPCGCTINLKRLRNVKKSKVPLFLHPSVDSFIYPNNKDSYGNILLSIGDGQSFRMYCPDKITYIGEECNTKRVREENSLDESSTGKQSNDKIITLKCMNGEFYKGNKKVMIYTLGCEKAVPPVLKEKKELCANVGADGKQVAQDSHNLAHITIGWEKNPGNQPLMNQEIESIPQIEVCLDRTFYGPLWTKHILLGKSIDFKESGGDRPDFRSEEKYVESCDLSGTTLLLTCLYSKDIQKLTFRRALGQENNLIETEGGEKYLAKGHLAPDADFVYKTFRDATYFFVNAAPQYQSFNNGNWKTLEEEIRDYASSKGNPLTVWTGTFGVLEYRDINKNLQPIYLNDLYTENIKRIPVPKYFWKIFYDPENHAGAAFIGLNDVNAPLPVAGILPKLAGGGDSGCTWAVCDGWDWVKSENWNDVKKGFMYCCTIGEAIQVIPTLPIEFYDDNDNDMKIMKQAKLIQDPKLPLPTGEVPVPADAA